MQYGSINIQLQELFHWKSCLNFAFFHSNLCENIASLVVAKSVTKKKNVLDNGQTNNIFTRVTMEKNV